MEYLFFSFPGFSELANRYNEVLGIDATYNCNKYGMPLVVFVCMDNHGHSLPIAGCFINSESEQRYRDSLQLYEKAGYRRPATVLTDRAKALGSAIAKEWGESAHVVCKFHIHRNI